VNGHFEIEIIRNNHCPCIDITSSMIPSHREFIPLSSTGDDQKFVFLPNVQLESYL
jgi:hypothetical protein